jgi:Rrf2 family nitric oxide-sensitive transcriptional repressor
MLSQTVEYALRAMVVLAKADDSARTARAVADIAKVPLDYLFKVMQSLSRAGLVIAQRGKRGGFSLARGPAQITILDVVNAVDPLGRIDSCPLKLKSHEFRMCALHRRLDSALAIMEQAFASTTLSELLESSDGVQPLCESMVQLHVNAH